MKKIMLILAGAVVAMQASAELVVDGGFDSGFVESIDVLSGDIWTNGTVGMGWYVGDDSFTNPTNPPSPHWTVTNGVSARDDNTQWSRRGFGQVVSNPLDGQYDAGENVNFSFDWAVGQFGSGSNGSGGLHYAVYGTTGSGDWLETSGFDRLDMTPAFVEKGDIFAVGETIGAPNNHYFTMLEEGQLSKGTYGGGTLSVDHLLANTYDHFVIAFWADDGDLGHDTTVDNVSFVAAAPAPTLELVVNGGFDSGFAGPIDLLSGDILAEPWDPINETATVGQGWFVGDALGETGGQPWWTITNGVSARTAQNGFATRAFAQIVANPKFSAGQFDNGAAVIFSFDWAVGQAGLTDTPGDPGERGMDYVLYGITGSGSWAESSGGSLDRIDTSLANVVKGDIFGTGEVLAAPNAYYFTMLTEGNLSPSADGSGSIETDIVLTNAYEFFAIAFYADDGNAGFDTTVDNVSLRPDQILIVGDLSMELLSGGSNLALTWDTSSEGIYDLESKSNLTDVAWATDLASIPGGTNGSVTVTTAVDQVQSFYRVSGE
jgi:hypothetical protein